MAVKGEMLLIDIAVKGEMLGSSNVRPNQWGLKAVIDEETESLEALLRRDECVLE